MMPRTVNLNLLPTLRALIREGSVSKAAVALGLSQPATSAALAQLRILLADPLLIRIGRTMQVTARAKEIGAQIELVFSNIETLLNGERFAPASAQRIFRVAAPDYMVFLLGEIFLNILPERAPGISVSFADVPHDLTDQLARGELDVCVCADVGLWASLRRLNGFADSMVGVVAKDHLLTRGEPLGPAAIVDFPQFTFGGGLGPGNIPPPEPPPGHVANPLLAAEQFMSLVFLTPQSDCVARVPRSLATRVVKVLPLSIIELPGLHNVINTTIFWGPLQDMDPANQWLRGVLAECLTALFDAV